MREDAGLGVAEVGECELEPVDDYEEQGPPEVGAAPEVDEAEEEEIVGYEMRSKVAGCGDGIDRVRGLEEGSEVRHLEEVEHDPVFLR